MSQTPVTPPKLRGWFHLGATPAVIIASLVLFILSKSSLKFAVAIYSITAIMLFSVSAIYHRVPWVPEKKKIWRRWDHANINLLIAGSYTPFAVALLEGRDRTILLLLCGSGLQWVLLFVFSGLVHLGGYTSPTTWLWDGSQFSTLLRYIAQVVCGYYFLLQSGAFSTPSVRSFTPLSALDARLSTSASTSFFIYSCSPRGSVST